MEKEDKESAIVKAIAFGENAHKGQKDDIGKDYFKAHCIPVGEAIQHFTTDLDIITAAYLHDTLEDTNTTYYELEKQFNKRVADLVLEVTHAGENDEYGHYFPLLHSAEGILIKLLDRASNISRMEAWSTKRREHYLKKTKFWKTTKTDGGL